MRFVILLCFMMCCGGLIQAQDSTLLHMLNDSIPARSSPVKATFKAIHIVNTQTIESPAKQDLNFIIMHRFGKLNDGGYNFFGLDNATIRLGLDYGLTDRLAVGVGRSSFEKTFDGYLKYKLLQQTEGGSLSFPISMSVLGALSHYTLKMPDKPFLNSKYRTSYTVQAILARKFSSNLSLQLTPTWLHYNLTPTTADKNDVFAGVVSGRYKFTRRMSLTAEYNYLPAGQVESIEVKNSLSLGVDIETGGHVFQLIFTNSQAMTEPQYIGRTTGSWGKGDIYFGFNVSRNFSLGRKKKW
ncbi:MAG: DUF5777 family beta-barrel protein [Candidatus Pseudobacter hemicellulosilyticus]|uniref:DUF5777 family beta-barrel protein n=1 Tax=Candidatus Pseudobacter hemicellulosilyticus TaxID=3121375 RepID=A0AAJ5WTX8_9BACT|nr:MAG: DUF5777 family beta-barrel protein [Pseudobacter sp.]